MSENLQRYAPDHSEWEVSIAESQNWEHVKNTRTLDETPYDQWMHVDRALYVTADRMDGQYVVSYPTRRGEVGDHGLANIYATKRFDEKPGAETFIRHYLTRPGVLE